MAAVSHAYRAADDTVGMFGGPLSLFFSLVWLGSLVPALILWLLVPVSLGLLVVLAALIMASAVGIGAWWRVRRGARGFCYAITDRRILTTHGAEVDWVLHEGWDDVRVLWKLAGIGTVQFGRRSDAELDLRFAGVRDPEAIARVARSAAEARPRRPT